MASLRRLLIWLLVLAVPAQAVAAATRALCDAQGWSAALLAAAPTSFDTSSAPHDGCAGHALRSSAVQPSAATVSADDGGASAAGVPTATDTGTHSCSACASCNAAALLGTAPVITAPELVASSFVARVASIDPGATGGPDRPPRARLA